MLEPAVWIAILSAGFGAYFAALHIALKSFSRTRLGEMLPEDGREARLEAFVSRVDMYLIVTGMLRTCLSLVLLLAVLDLVRARWPAWPMWQHYGVAFVIAGLALSLVVVALPVSWARHQRESLLAMSMRVLKIVTVALWFVAYPLLRIDGLVRRLSGADAVAATPQRDSTELSDEVLTVVEEHHHGQAVDDVQKEMLEAVFSLPQTTAGEVMTPRTEVQAIEIGSSLEQIKQAVIAMGHSRIPVYQDTLDNVVGVLYAKDLIAYLGNGKDFDLRKVMRTAFMVPESKIVRELLAEFKARKVHMAVVLDEYGGMAGLVTIEDIIEEIVGDIQDEYELKDESLYVRLDDATSDVDARMRIDDFNEVLEAELPEDEDYDTLGGFVASQLGHIPAAGEGFEYGGFRFTVTDAERTKVKRVRVEKLPVPESAAATQPAGK